ncbi:MAG: HPr family phosphocarrier protein [Clostridiales bacterium]|nr:HPr family phosphocarrier protein [Clostridiales bacterium]MDE7422201.1 HPr family phosphocarrier protein [Lachnospiraceae bacterium]
MVSQKITIKNEQGLHMRPAGVFAKAVAPFQSDVKIKVGDKTVNGKSIMNIIGACIKYGTEIEIICEGADEEAALKEAISQIESGMGE